MKRTKTKTYKTAFDLIGEPKLNHKITVRKRAEVKNELGQVSSEYYDFKTCYAAVIDQSNKFSNHSASDTIFVNTSQKFIIRYDKNIDNTMLIVFNNRTFAVDYIEDKYNERKYLTIYASDVK